MSPSDGVVRLYQKHLGIFINSEQYLAGLGHAWEEEKTRFREALQKPGRNVTVDDPVSGEMEDHCVGDEICAGNQTYINILSTESLTSCPLRSSEGFVPRKDLDLLLFLVTRLLENHSQ